MDYDIFQLEALLTLINGCSFIRRRGQVDKKVRYKVAVGSFQVYQLPCETLMLPIPFQCLLETNSSSKVEHFYWAAYANKLL